MTELCENCGTELITVIEISSGLCDDCYKEQMDILASNIINEPSMFPNEQDFC